MEFHIKGLNKLSKFAHNFPSLSEPHINKAIVRSLTRVWGKEKIEAPFGVSGNLRDNWTLNAGRFEGSLRSNALYGKNIETGQQLSVFPSAEQLKPWAAKKGLNPWAVAKAIKKRGHLIKNPFFTRSLQGASEGVQIEFAQAINGILKELNNLSD